MSNKHYKYQLVNKISNQIYIEIQFYLSARKTYFDMYHLLKDNISEYEKEINLITSIVLNLPSEYDLITESFKYIQGVYINLEYTTLFSRSSNSRIDILINVRKVIAEMQKINSQIIHTYDETHDIRHNYKKIYDKTCSEFNLWIDVAQRKINIPVTILAKRETLGKLLPF
jgi:galactitol-specific phosphotransferase system IIB component